MRPDLLAQTEIERRLGTVPGWEFHEGKLHRNFRFKDFSEAFAFMTRSAMMAECLNHHPEWSNVYNRVDVGLTTHDPRGITHLDFDLATAMNAYAVSIAQ